MTREVEAAEARRRRRELSAPVPSFPPELPVVARRSEIAAAIRENQVVVVCGETGSGKTTQLPKICLELGRGVLGMIGHTQPRRIAARSVAARIAEELESPLGRVVGHKVRFEDRTGEDTLVKVMTDGILLAETLGDRLLEAYDTIIIDEAHERSLNIDFLLGYLKRLLPRRPDLRVIITSATIDPDRFAAHFAGARGPAPIVEVSGRVHAVELRYRPLAGEEDDRDLTMEEGIVAAVGEVCAIDPGGRGDVLVFLSTEREIRETSVLLRKHHPPGTEILPLYARLSAREQMRAFRPHTGRRIVLATNVAETSLTVPGIRYVVDPGYARISRYSARTKVQRLPIEPISRASADQRAGRCGRVEAGVCVRLYTPEDYGARARFTEPEILRTNLASVILQMKALGLGAVEEFPFVEAPDSRMIKDGYDTLRELGAVDERGELTTIGAELARLPIDPKLGRMILAADREHCLAEVLVIAAALSVQDPRERPLEKQDAADQAHRRFRDEGSDFVSYLRLWTFFHERARLLSGAGLRKLCRESFLSFVRMREWHDVRQQLHAIVGEMGKRAGVMDAWGGAMEETAAGAGKATGRALEQKRSAVHRAVLSGLLSNVGRRNGDTHEYAGTRGTRFHLFPGSGLFKTNAPWVMAGEVVATTRTYARTVARIDPAWIEDVGGHAVSRSYVEPHWAASAGQVFAYERVTLYGLEVVARRRVVYGPIDPAGAREIFIQGALVEGQLRTDGPFLLHNRAVLESARLVEAKARRNDLVADARRRFAFYDARVPRDVWDSHRFERWRRSEEKKSARVLYMTEGDVLTEVPPDVTPHRFPDSLHLAGTAMAVSYVHDPSSAADGVTMSVPVEALGHLGAHCGQTLVPGMVREKVEAIIRTLPRSLRKFVSAEVTARCLPAVASAEARSIPEVLAEELSRELGLDVRPESFRPDELPGFLRMNFRVLDAEGRVLAEGRDLGLLQRDLAVRVRAGFGSMVPPSFDRRAVRDWDFGELPESVTLSNAGLTLRGYPALVDEGGSAGLRLFETPGRASAAMREGLRALFLVRAADEIRRSVRTMERAPGMTVRYAAVAPGRALAQDLSLLIAERAFMTGVPVRSREGFEAALAVGWGRIDGAAREVEDTVSRILDALHTVRVNLGAATAPAFAPAVADIEAQLDELAQDGFLTRTAWGRLVHFARYLHAIEERLVRLMNAGLARDTRDMEIVGRHWRRWIEARHAVEERGGEDGELEVYRWMIEELRVSLFAQRLGTAEPVSAKRLEEQWEKTKR